ncbi:MAG: ThiF family adenylyltransferase [Candidatus Dormibacteraeota bacterium]|nr:ThiF family adenylyltransferase [Candidatus Dormibacteraeota bacterium]
MPSKPEDHESFYAELTARNRGLIAPDLQSALRKTRIIVAGCGSTGGAVLMPLVRTGAEDLVLLDPGQYELNNLNRQDASLADIARNKARASADRLLAVNPHC